MTSEVFSWSGERYSLRHFMDLYGHNLPQIVLVTEGYAGRDDELHQFGAEERPSKPAMTSLSSAQDLPLQEAIRQYTHYEDLICFSRDGKVQLCSSADRTYTQRLGLMEKLDEYEQKYLVAYSLVEDVVASQKTSIPLYVPIRVKVATGLAGFGEKQFTNYTEALERKVSRFREGRVKLEAGVLQFDEIPEGDYTYVEPIFRTMPDESKHPPTPAPRKQSKSTTSSPSNQGPRSPQEVVRPHTVEKIKSLLAVKRPSPPVPGPKPVVATVSPLQPRLANAPHEIDSEEKETSIVEAVASVVVTQSERRPWRTIREIPANIEDFTVREVIVCLNLLKLDKLAASIEEQFVDGAFLVSLDENIFVNDFNCSRFEARKLDQFIKGWRPKT